MVKHERFNRRSVLKGAVAGAGAAAVVSQGFIKASAQNATPAAPLTGSIKVSYPDQAGLKPKYVTQAAGNVQKDNPGATVNVDLENLGDDDFYTKLLLALDSGSGPDV